MTEVLGFAGLLLLGVVLFGLLAAGMWALFRKSLPLVAREARKDMEAIDAELSEPRQIPKDARTGQKKPKPGPGAP